MSEQMNHEPSITEWRTQELLVRLEERMRQVQQDIVDIRSDIDKNLVKIGDFKPVRLAVYAGVSMVATGFFTLLLAFATGKI